MKPHVIQLFSSAAMASSLVFIPLLAKNELGASDFQVGLIVAVFGVMSFVSSYFFGRASDVYSRKFLIHVGLAVSAVAFFLQALTDPSFFFPVWAEPWLLALARALAGFSMGIFPAALTAHVYESRRGLGGFTAFGALGWSIGTFVAGLIALYWGVFVFSSFCLPTGFPNFFYNGRNSYTQS